MSAFTAVIVLELSKTYSVVRVGSTLDHDLNNSDGVDNNLNNHANNN